MKEEILKVVCETLDVKPEELKDGQTLYESIGVDSTEMVELVLALKKAFGVMIEKDEIGKASTLEDIVKVIKSKKE